MTLTIAWKDGSTSKVRATKVNAVMAIHAHEWGDGYQSLTHIPTGYRIATTKGAAMARRIAGALLAKYPEGRWAFTDPKRARRMERGARQIIIDESRVQEIRKGRR